MRSGVDRLHDDGATEAQQLAFAMGEVVDRLVAATAAGASVGDRCRQNRCRLCRRLGVLRRDRQAPRGSRALGGCAGGLRSARSGDAAACPHRQPGKSADDPYTNLLRDTTEAMSAAIGGASTLLVEPHGYDAHLALNIPRILAEEAHLDAVADPAGGSYYVESLTDALAREAWALFQQRRSRLTDAAAGHVRQRPRRVQRAPTFRGGPQPPSARRDSRGSGRPDDQPRRPMRPRH